MRVRPAVSDLLVASSSGAERCVRAAHRREARTAIAALPRADLALLRRHGLRVELVGARALEDGMLGATTVVRNARGALVPTKIRVASGARGVGAESLAEIVQHEVGHAISVLRRQDDSERAATAYARQH